MRYLRHLPLTAWLVVCVALAVLMGSAIVVGMRTESAPSAPWSTKGPIPLTQTDQNNILALRNRAASLPGAMTNMVTLQQWSDGTAALANAAARARVDAVGGTDQVSVTFATVEKAAKALPRSNNIKADAAYLAANLDQLATVALTGNAVKLPKATSSAPKGTTAKPGKKKNTTRKPHNSSTVKGAQS